MEKVVRAKELLEYIVEKLKTEGAFRNYQFSKNNKTLIQKTKDGYFRIELNTYLNFDLDRKEASNEVIPYYYRKFDILHDWFKEHTALSKSDFNSRASIFLEGSNLDFQNEFHFLVTNQDLQKDFNFFKEQLILTENKFLKKFQSLQDLFEYEALPIINNKDHKFNFNNCEDLFILMRLVYIVSPNDFNELNLKVYNHIAYLVEKEHLHAMLQFPKYDEIIKDLKNV